MNVEKDLKAAINIINNNIYNTNYRKPNDTTDENILDYFNYLNINNKNILLVANSGDHILQALINNVKNVYAFDSNIFSFYTIELKICACKYLNYLDYINYYYNEDNESYFSIDIYNKFSKYLKTDTKYFWDNLYKEKKFINNPLTFFIDGNTINNKNTNITNINNYYLLQEKLKLNKINYYICEFYDIFKYIDNDIYFDSVYLSKIYKYIEDKNKFVKFIKNNLKNRLNENAIVEIFYSKNFSSDNLRTLEKSFKDSIIINKNKMLIYKK